MRYRAFVPYSILGTGLWASAHILIGYFFSRSIDTAAKYAGRGAFLLGTLIVIIVGTVWSCRPSGSRRTGAPRCAGWRPTRRPAGSSPSARRFQPQLGFLWDRVTPGGTFGLEFTSLMATLAVASFVLVAYTAISAATPVRPPATHRDGNRRKLRTGWLVDLAKPVTRLARRVSWPLAAVSRRLLAARRRWAELGVLSPGWRSIVAGVHEIKDAVARPRPAGGARRRSGSSFPSGHAAYSIFYVWLAVTIVVRLRAGWRGGALVVAAGIALTALIGSPASTSASTT